MTISKSNFIVISTVMITILLLFQFSNISANYVSKSMYNQNAEEHVSISSTQILDREVLELPENYNTTEQGGDYWKPAQPGSEHCRRMVHLYKTHLPAFYEPSGIYSKPFLLLHNDYFKFHISMHKKGC